MKKMLYTFLLLLILAGLNSTLMAQPQYYNATTGAGANNFPFNVTTGKDVQLLYLANAFSSPSPAPAGNITGFSLMLDASFGPTTYTTLTIQMGQTSITTFPASLYTGPLTTVYTRTSVSLSGTVNNWMNFTLDTPFPYDPTQSLVVDIGQCGASGGGPSIWYLVPAGNQRTWSVGGCPFAYYGENAEIYVGGITIATSGPPICVTTAATSVLGTSATLNGTVNANGSSATVSFDYGLTTSYGTNVAGVPATVSGSSASPVSAAITGLTPNTTYHFRVNGVNSQGTTNGNDMTFTTAPPPPTVVTTAATGIGLNTATVNGTVNANGGNATVTFQYGLTTSYGTTVPGTPSTVTGNSVTNVSASLTGLAANTTYHYMAVAVNAGSTTNGNDMTFTTAGPPIVVTNNASNITMTSAQLNGTVTANNLSTTVSFNWGLTTAYGNIAAAVPATVTGNSATAVMANITGLTNLVTYHYQCVGVNAGGTTLGADQAFQTGCTAPAAPGTISGPVNVCQGGSGYVYSIAPIPNAVSYVWTLPVGASITLGAGTNSITVSYSPTAQYGFVTAAGVGLCGTGPSGSLTINVFPPAAPTISGPAQACQGATSVYMTQYGFSNYVWTATGGTITSGQGTYSVNVQWTSSGAQSVSVNYNSLNGCPALTPTVYNVTVNALPSPSISGPNNLCPNAGLAAYTTQAGFSNYAWTVSSGGTIASGQGTNSINITWNNSGAQTVTVNYTNALGCSGLSPAVYGVTVNPLPGPAGTISGTATVCAGVSNVAYSVGTIQNASAYVWNLPPGATNASGNNVSAIMVDFANNATSGPITVYGNNLCGNGPVSPAFNVTVNPLPDPAGTITGPASVCAGATGVVYTVSSINNATGYIWTVPAGAAIGSGENTNMITVDFAANAVSGNITVQGTNACGDGTVSSNFAVTIKPVPPAPVITLSGLTLHSNTATGNQWYLAGTLIPFATSQNYTATQGGVYWDVVTLNGCASDSSNHIMIIPEGVNSHSSAGVSIYPVPNEGQFNMSITTASSETFSVSVYNSLGVKIYEEPKVNVNGTLHKVIDLRPVPNGVYTIIVEDNQNQIVKKIVVNK